MGNFDFNKLPCNNQTVRAIHTAVKGRARFKVNGLYQNEALKRYLESRLSRSEEIAQVSANNYTGNILVIFHPNFSPQAIALLIQGIVLDYRKQGTPREATKSQFVKMAEPSAAVIPDSNLHSVTAKEIVTAAKGSQLIVLSGAVCTLICGTALLHAYSLDTRILLLIQKLHTPTWDRIMLGITFIGEPVVLLGICLALGIGQIYYNRRSEATTLGIAALGGISLNYLLKVLFGRARPALWNRIIHVGLHSFPSGHAMVSTVIYGFIGYILAKEFPQKRWRIFALTAILILAIGFSRLYLGVHWPTDVVAGYAAGLVWLIACINLQLWQKYPSLSKHSLIEYSNNALKSSNHGVPNPC